MNNVDLEYQRLLQLILTKGKWKNNRTGVKTLSIFGAQARFDLREGFTMLTTKRVYWRGVVHELLWFLSGSTNIKYLIDNNVHIWDADAYRNYKAKIEESNKQAAAKEEWGIIPYSLEEFVEQIETNNDFAAEWGDLGPIYGKQWRNWNGIDQLQVIVDTLKKDPDSRRILLSAWNVSDLDKMVLSPCHVLYNFNTEELTLEERAYEASDAKYNLQFCGSPDLKQWNHENFDDIKVPRRRLNCLFYCRSQDFLLGTPFNWASAALLIHMITHVTNMLPGELIWSGGDIHAYENQIEGAMEQLAREPRELPTLCLNPEVKNLFDFRFEDVDLIGYNPHPAIKMPLSVG